MSLELDSRDTAQRSVGPRYPRAGSRGESFINIGISSRQLFLPPFYHPHFPLSFSLRNMGSNGINGVRDDGAAGVVVNGGADTLNGVAHTSRSLKPGIWAPIPTFFHSETEDIGTLWSSLLSGFMLKSCIYLP